jgi:putative ABC transport system substrate-binding protein
MRRREFMTLLGGAVAVLPLATQAQDVVPDTRSTVRSARIAKVSFLDAAKAQPYGHAFLDGLRALGWIEGRNIAIEQRFAEGEDDRLPAIVDEILGMRPDVIVIDGARVVQAFRARGAAIPIVTSVVSDPVGAGFIASFARPGGNITGMAFQDAELISKRAELLKELVPGLVRVALLIDPGARPGAPDLCVMCLPHRPNKYFHVTASNGIVSSSPYTPLAIMTASPRSGYSKTSSMIDRAIIMLNDHRFRGNASGRPSSG